MKIGQQPELSGAAAQTGLAKQAKSPIVATEETAKGASAAPAAGVPVTVSMAAQALHQTTRTMGDFDAGKVKAVRAAMDKGAFTVDAEAIADKMLSNAHEIFSRSRD